MGALVTPAVMPDGWYLYCTEGTLIWQWGQGEDAVMLQSQPDVAPKLLPVPKRLIEVLPAIEDPIVQRWAALVRDFVADIKGRPHEPYLTFRDGWRYQQVIDTVRSGEGWRELPTTTQ
jgi:hypothetical protein